MTAHIVFIIAFFIFDFVIFCTLSFICCYIHNTPLAYNSQYFFSLFFYIFLCTIFPQQKNSLAKLYKKFVQANYPLNMCFQFPSLL